MASPHEPSRQRGRGSVVAGSVAPFGWARRGLGGVDNGDRRAETDALMRAGARLRLVHEGGGDDEPATPEELNLRVLLPLMRYLRAEFGQATIDRLARDAGIDEELLRRANAWTSHPCFEAMLAGARKLFDSDQAFMRACTHDMVKVYGPLLLVIRCISVESAYRMMAGTSHLATRISRYEVRASSRTSIRLRYVSTKTESRLMCLSRQAQLRAGPTLYWGMAPAALHESKCLAHGDDACEYTLRWYQPLRWRGPLLGGLLGALPLAIALLLGVTPAPLLAVMAVLLGMASGLAIEQRRLVSDHLQFAEQTNREFDHLVQAHAWAVDEVLALHQRERQWGEQREAALEERAARLDRVVDRLQDIGEPNRDKLRNLSHDINNPLAVLLGIAAHMRRAMTSEDLADTATTLETTVSQLSGLVREIANIASHEPATPFEPARIDVTELTQRMRRQLRATVVARDIRVTVFQTREAPEHIVTLPAMLERVIDNILTNAAKYTERGSIVVEVGGTPGHLLLKVSDTGRGIGPERLEQVLSTGGPDPNPPVGGSHGAGLSIVARLLDGLGGRLEIMSEPGRGTTLWVYVPSDLARAELGPRELPADDSLQGVMERVVRVRAKPTFGGDGS